MSFTVLIADDEQLERDALCSVIDGISDGDWEILAAETGTEAIDIAGRHRIDLAFLDIAMPGRSGLEVAETIRRRGDTTAIVFVTAFDYFEYARTALRLHAEDYLVKPVEDDAVERIVRRVHDRWLREESLPSERRNDSERRTDDGTRHGDSADPGQERLSELIRFLELELLDDLIAGDTDGDDLVSAFGLLGISRIQGVAVVAKPELEAYPFRLETAGQRRTVVQRALRAIARAFEGAHRSVLTRAHIDLGYLIVLTSDTQDPGTLSGLVEPDALARIGDTVAGAVSIPVQLRGTMPFRSAAELSAQIRETRRRLFSPDDAHPVAWQELHPEAAAEQRILKALTDDDGAAARLGAEELWGLFVADGDGDPSGDEPVSEAGNAVSRRLPPDRLLLERANGTLSFLARALRAKGLDVPSDTAVVLDETVGDRRVLRGEFVRRIATFRDVSEGIPDDSIVRRVREFLRERYREEVGLTDIAGYIGLSESHCSREITRRFGTSFSHLLREHRLQVARRLLADDTRTIKEVADGAGFRDANYFSRVFQREYGMSPRDFRRTIV
jgi:two-component system response regulator YesN